MRRTSRYTYIILVLLANGLLLQPITGSAKSKNAEPAKSTLRYVNDTLTITMRTGKSNQHKIIRSLDSGTKVWVLETDDTYSRIKTEKGDSGWVLSQYLTPEPIARDLLPPLQEKLTQFETQNKEMAQDLKDVTKERNELRIVAAKYEKLAIDHNKLTEELTRLRGASSKSEQLMKQTETLSRKNASLESQLDFIEQEIHELRNGNNKLWFLTGAGVVLVGIILGALLARGRREKKTSWGEGPKTLTLKQL